MSKEQRKDQVLLNFKVWTEITESQSHNPVSPCSRYLLLLNNYSKNYWSKTISILLRSQFCGSEI